MDGAEGFISALVEMLEAYRIVMSETVKRLSRVESMLSEDVVLRRGSVPIEELINRIEALEETIKNMGKDYDSKFDELYVMRNDVEIVSKELIEVKNLALELARMTEKTGPENI